MVGATLHFRETSSDETDGITWTAYNSQKFSDGPYRMAFDPVNRIVYSATGMRASGPEGSVKPWRRAGR